MEGNDNQESKIKLDFITTYFIFLDGNVERERAGHTHALYYAPPSRGVVGKIQNGGRHGSGSETLQRR